MAKSVYDEQQEFLALPESERLAALDGMDSIYRLFVARDYPDVSSAVLEKIIALATVEDDWSCEAAVEAKRRLLRRKINYWNKKYPLPEAGQRVIIATNLVDIRFPNVRTATIRDYICMDTHEIIITGRRYSGLLLTKTVRFKLENEPEQVAPGNRLSMDGVDALTWRVMAAFDTSMGKYEFVEKYQWRRYFASTEFTEPTWVFVVAPRD